MNQCDGCKRRIPVVNGMHDLTGTTGSYPGEKMSCTALLYGATPRTPDLEWDIADDAFNKELAHLYPLGEVHHFVNRNCLCKPKFDDEDDHLVVHNYRDSKRV